MNFRPARYNATKPTPRQRKLFWYVALPYGGKILRKKEDDALELAILVAKGLQPQYSVKVFAPGGVKPRYVLRWDAAAQTVAFETVEGDPVAAFRSA